MKLFLFLALLSMQLAAQVEADQKMSGPTTLGSPPGSLGCYDGFIRQGYSDLHIQDSNSFIYVHNSARAYPNHANLADASNISMYLYSAFYDYGRNLKLEKGSTIVGNGYFVGVAIMGDLHLIASKITFNRSYELSGFGDKQSLGIFNSYGKFSVDHTSIMLGVYSHTNLNLNGPGIIRAPINTGRFSTLNLAITGNDQTVVSQIDGPIQVDDYGTLNAHDTSAFMVHSGGSIHASQYSTFEIAGTKLEIYQPVVIGEHSTLKLALGSDYTCLVLGPLTVASHTVITVTSPNDSHFPFILHCSRFGTALPAAIQARIAQLKQA